MKKLKPAVGTGVKNLIFDLGGVLLDIDIPRSVQAFRELGLTGLDPVDIHPDNRGIFLQLELGNISEEDFVAGLQKCASSEGPVPTREQLLAAWNALLLPFDWKRFELLDELRASGYKVFLLSNTNMPNRKHFIPEFDQKNPAGRTFESYFDYCFYSDTMHMRKPDADIYLEVLKEAGIKAEESLFIDDNKPNTDGGARVGLQTYHLAAPATVFDLFE